MTPGPDTLSIAKSCGQLASQIQLGVQSRLGVIGGACAILLLLGAVYGLPHFGALAWIVAGVLLPIAAWCRLHHPGLPLVCLVALQTFAIFATPILRQNPSLQIFPPEDIYRAGVEVFFFGLALALGWRLVFGPDLPARPPRHYHAISFIDPSRPKTLDRTALILLSVGTAFQFTVEMDLLGPLWEVLPWTFFPILRTLFEASSMAGALLGAYSVGAGAMPSDQRRLFWTLITLHLLLRASSILLSNTTGVSTAVVIGYFLGARRPPWTFLVILLAALSFLNLSKFEMRSKYWNDKGLYQSPDVVELPGYFIEWTGHSLDILTFNRSITEEEKAAGQRLTDRLDNLQNLLFVQAAIRHVNKVPLYGDTYALIPKLFIPRFLWPEKPTSHEGQVMLNIHFSRQRAEDTLRTFVAWGLLAEAYGNFSSVWGALICGSFLGAFIGLLERLIRPYPVTSLQAFFFLIISINLCLSFEMVASVWLTSLFQILVALLISVLPFGRAHILRHGPT